MGIRGGFAGLEMRFGDLAGAFATFAGAEFAILINDRVYVGVRGAGLATDNAMAQGPTGQDTLKMGYGGLVVGHLVPLTSQMDLAVDALVGAGSYGAASTPSSEHDAVFVFEPSASLALRVLPFMRIGVGASYRFVGDASFGGVRDADLRGLTGMLYVRVGRFPAGPKSSSR